MVCPHGAILLGADCTEGDSLKSACSADLGCQVSDGNGGIPRGRDAAVATSGVLPGELPIQHDQRLQVLRQHEAQLSAGMPEALQLPPEPYLRVLPRQLAEQLRGRVLLGALDVQQDVAQYIQPPRGRVRAFDLEAWRMAKGPTPLH